MSAGLALLASLFWGVSDFLGGTASRTLPVASVLWLSQATALVGLLPVAVLTGPSGLDAAYAVPAVAAGLLGLVALGAFYRALAVGTMGVVAPVASLGVVVPVAGGLLAGEAPRPLQTAGIVLAVVGVVLASGPELREGGSGGTALALALVAAVGFGAVLLLLARAAEHSVLMTLVVMRLTAVLVLGAGLLAVAARRRQGLGVPLRRLPLVTAVGAGDVLANASFAVASARAGALVSVTSVLASLYPVVTVLLARQVHGERLQRVQAVGVVGALGGVALLAGSAGA